jgi:hypothetical protein
MTENETGTAIIGFGYLVNFNVAHIRDGVVRLVNGLQPSASSAKPRRPLR